MYIHKLRVWGFLSTECHQLATKKTSLIAVESKKTSCYRLGLKSSWEAVRSFAWNGHRASLTASVEARFGFGKKKNAILLAEKITFSHDIQKRKWCGSVLQIYWQMHASHLLLNKNKVEWKTISEKGTWVVSALLMRIKQAVCTLHLLCTNCLSVDFPAGPGSVTLIMLSNSLTWVQPL